MEDRTSGQAAHLAGARRQKCGNGILESSLFAFRGIFLPSHSIAHEECPGQMNFGGLKMPIIYNQDDRTFTLQAQSVSYQMKTDERGVLQHTYFGRKMDGSDCSFDYPRKEYGFSGQPSDAAEDRSYSLDSLLQEYPVTGTGDYRRTCLEGYNDETSGMLDLRYHFHQVRKEKYSLKGLPALFERNGEDAETLIVTLKDRWSEIYADLYYAVFPEKNLITRAAVIRNETQEPFVLTRVMSLCLDFPDDNQEIIHLPGCYAMERIPERVRPARGVTCFSSRRGHSSHQENPAVILCDPETDEDHGACAAAVLVYSGGFVIEVEKTQTSSLRLTAGIDDHDLRWVLAPGESFTAPEVILAYSSDGLGDLSRTLHRGMRENLISPYWQKHSRPVVINNWEATYFDYDMEKLLSIAREAAAFGAQMLVLDDGWFGARSDDTSSLGDWVVNEKKLGCSLNDLGKSLSDIGMQLGLWIEPEMISENSDLYRAHPDWVLGCPERGRVFSRGQLVLDITREDVRGYLKDCVDHIMAQADIACLKWDMNRSICNLYSAARPGASQGELRHRYVLGLYELLEYVCDKYPQLLIEGCSGGGGRFDAGMLYYTPQIWCSDKTDPIDRVRIQNGTSLIYPVSSISAHVSQSPNHQTRRVTPVSARCYCAMQGAYGFEVDPAVLSEEDKAFLRQETAFYIENQDLIRNGDYFRLYSSDSCSAWSFVSEDRKKALIILVFTADEIMQGQIRIFPKGLLENALYSCGSYTRSGYEFMRDGICEAGQKYLYESRKILIEMI